MCRAEGTFRGNVMLADEIERRIQESLQEDDDQTEIRRRLNAYWRT